MMPYDSTDIVKNIDIIMSCKRIIWNTLQSIMVLRNILMKIEMTVHH